MKKCLIIGNWKMHLNVHEASILVKRLSDNIAVHRNIEVILAPSLLTLVSVSQEIDRRKFALAAQNAYFKDEGAFTGEVSYSMLRGLTEYALIGHSERRLYFHEGLDVVRNKVASAVRNHIRPVICVGETEQEKEQGETKRVIHDQVTTALADLAAEDLDEVVIAYEPNWAISTFEAKTATAEDVEPIVELIKYNVSELYGQKAAQAVTIIYGGSVNDQDAETFLNMKGIEGVMPGSASLNYEKFAAIVETAYRLNHKVE